MSLLPYKIGAIILTSIIDNKNMRSSRNMVLTDNFPRLLSFSLWYILTLICTTSSLMHIHMSSLPSSPSSAIIGLNAALQRVINLDLLRPGEVNRGRRVTIGIGGKGQDVALAARYMNLISQPCLIQFVGQGSEGDTLLNLLEISKCNKNSITVRPEARLRTCITLVDRSNGESTEIIEPSGAIRPEEISLLLNTVEKQYEGDKLKGLAVMGSMPPGCHKQLYSQIIQKSCDSNTKVIA